MLKQKSRKDDILETNYSQSDNTETETIEGLRAKVRTLSLENDDLRNRHATAVQYIRHKVNQLLTVMGTSPLRPEELDDISLIETDPIGIISDSFVQILKHLHKTNESLKIAKEEIQAIFNSAGIGILVLDQHMHILAHNSALREQFFPEKSDMVGRPCYEAICNIEDPVEYCPFDEIFETGESVHQMQWILRGRYYDVVGTPVRDEEGDISRIVLVYMDITERISAGEALRKSEEKYRDLFENANDLIQSIGPDGSVLYVNNAWRETLGYSQEEIEDLSIFDVIHPECADNCTDDFRSVVCGEKDGRIETMFITKSGEKIIAEGNVNTISEDGKFLGTRGIFRDMTQRKEAEEALASEKERLAVTLRSIGDGVITTDTEGRVVLINKAAEAMTGWPQEEAYGRPVCYIFRIVDEKTRVHVEDPLGNLLSGDRPFELPGQKILISRDGSERLISDSGSPIRDVKSTIIGAVLVFRDETEKRKMEEDFLKTEKLESLGVLAGGLAHDFNNLLNAIIGNIDLVLSHVNSKDELHTRLMQAEKASFRAKDLTNQLLTFSRGGAPIKKATSIDELIKDSANFVVRGSHIKCEFSLPEDLWAVEIDEGQISQVINNLVINAVQSMPSGGLISISAENFIEGLSKPLETKEKKFVKISIKDNGMGIPQERLNRIFEPYYTTKDTGTGLGLATTYSIVRSHGGLIDVASEVGRGTTFSFFLPALPGTFLPLQVPGKGRSATVAKGRVLLMDDDELVRNTAAAMLKRIGYTAEFAEDGNEALLKYKEAIAKDKPFHALIVDLTVPGGMGGKETIKKLLEIDPSAKAIVSSGYSNDPIMANYRQHGFAGVLAKPYKLNDLRETLQIIVDTNL